MPQYEQFQIGGGGPHSPPFSCVLLEFPKLETVKFAPSNACSTAGYPFVYVLQIPSVMLSPMHETRVGGALELATHATAVTTSVATERDDLFMVPVESDEFPHRRVAATIFSYQ